MNLKAMVIIIANKTFVLISKVGLRRCFSICFANENELILYKKEPKMKEELLKVGLIFSRVAADN